MDQRACEILFSAYWGPGGWKPESARLVAQADFDYAKSKGIMFDPIRLNHDGVVSKAIAIREHIEPRAVADAFVASLGTHELAYRSALGSYAVLKNLPVHAWTGEQKACEICGGYGRTQARDEDLNVLNFERLKWGGVRHHRPLYAAFDLEQFQALPVARPEAGHIELFKDILKSIEATPPEVNAAKLQANLPKTLKSNKAERDVLVGILGFCGILATVDHPGFLASFIPANKRYLPGRRFVDMAYPACWWTGENGVNWDVVDFWFGHLL